MKQHNYLDLKIGDIAQYTMIVKNKDLSLWREKGWLTYTEIELPEGDEEAFMIYGKIGKNEQLLFNRPKLINQVEKKQIIGLEIMDYNANLGTYGMGGPGFFGLQLSNDEYITYAVWNAGNYVIINDRVVACNPNLYHKVQPWISNFGKDKTWNFLTEYISGGIITDYTVNIDSCQIEVIKKGEKFTITFVRNDSRLPRKVGRKRNAYKKGNIQEYIVFNTIRGTLIV